MWGLSTRSIDIARGNPQSDGDHRADRHTTAHRRRIAGQGVHAADGHDASAMLGIHLALQRPPGTMKFAVIAPVAAGVTADPIWTAAFAQYVEACGFESIVAVEHTVLMTQYTSVYPYDSSGRVELPADCPVPDPLSLLAFLAGRTDRLGLATQVLVLPKPPPGGVGQAGGHH